MNDIVFFDKNHVWLLKILALIKALQTYQFVVALVMINHWLILMNNALKSAGNSAIILIYILLLTLIRCKLLHVSPLCFQSSHIDFGSDWAVLALIIKLCSVSLFVDLQQEAALANIVFANKEAWCSLVVIKCNFTTLAVIVHRNLLYYFLDYFN